MRLKHPKPAKLQLSRKRAAPARSTATIPESAEPSRTLSAPCPDPCRNESMWVVCRACRPSWFGLTVTADESDRK